MQVNEAGQRDDGAQARRSTVYRVERIERQQGTRGRGCLQSRALPWQQPKPFKEKSGKKSETAHTGDGGGGVNGGLGHPAIDGDGRSGQINPQRLGGGAAAADTIVIAVVAHFCVRSATLVFVRVCSFRQTSFAESALEVVLVFAQSARVIASHGE